MLDKEKTDEPPKIDGPVKGCPNTSNPYHTCVEYCRKRYGQNATAPLPKVRTILYQLLFKKSPSAL